MSSKDDQISSNRRRLFKALSAAPVVATLRPGEALANTSAFQCIANLNKDGVTFNLGPVQETDVTPHYKYALVKVYYRRSGDNCAAEDDQDYVLEYNGQYHHHAADGFVTQNVDVTWNDAANRLKLTGDLCFSTEGQDRYVAVLGESSADGTHFTETGIYPIVNHPTYQGMTHTCMNSLVHSGSYTLHNG
jgi:hypothetical protein